MNRSLAGIAILAATISGTGKAMDSTVVATSIGDDFVNDIGIALNDAGSWFTAPLHFSGTDWIIAGAGVGSIGLAMTADEYVRMHVGRSTIQTLNNDFWDIPTRYGIPVYANSLGLVTYGAGLFGRNTWLRTTGRMIIEAQAFAGVTTIVLRYIAARSRPYSGDGPWHYNGFTWNNEIQSFPSGHTTVAFALSTVLAERIDNIWARIALYGFASLTAFSRVYNNQHWFSDVLVGAAIGIGSGLHVVSCETHRTSTATRGALEVLPTPEGIRLTLSIP